MLGSLLLYFDSPLRSEAVKDTWWIRCIDGLSSVLRGRRRRGSRRSTLGGKVVDPGYLGAILLGAHRRNLVELEVYGVYVPTAGHRVLLEQADV
jgi:hypothetical protein